MKPVSVLKEYLCFSFRNDLHVIYLLVIVITCKKITQGITVVILRMPLLRLLENTRTRDWRAFGKWPMIWSHILHHASMFATPHVNLFSLGSVDVIQFIDVSRYRCPRFHLVISHLYLSVISNSRTQWQISAYFPIYWNNSYQLNLESKLLQINDITTWGKQWNSMPLGCLLHHTSMFATPHVNRFSLASVDVI